MDRPEGGNGFGKFGEIQITLHSGNELDGVSAAKRNGSKRIPIEVLESSLRANRTRGHGFASDVDALEPVRPDVISSQANLRRLEMSRKELQRLRNLHRSDDVGDRSNHSRCLACRGSAGRGKIAEQASKARGRARNHRHHQAVAADCRGIDPGFGMLGARIIYDKAGFKIVEAIQYEIDIGEVVFDVPGIHIIDFGFDLNGGIDTTKFRFGRSGLWKTALDIGLIEQGLALQIGKLDEISIHYSQETNAGADKLIRHDRAERTEANQEDAR